MHRLEVHHSALQDLEVLRALHPRVVAEILVKLQELKGDHAKLSALLDHDYGRSGSKDIHVKKWQAQWKQHRDLWRFKIWSLEHKGIRIRIVYAYVPDDLTFYVMAVVKKQDFNYDDEQDPTTQRILLDYRDLKA